MKKHVTFRHEFVEAFPDKVEQGVLYISMPYATATHQCACGCGNEVVTPLSPTDWQLHFDGVSVSLSPSIGNWSFPCRSHYFIKHNKVQWAPQWSDKRIALGRAYDQRIKEEYFGQASHSGPQPAPKKEGRLRSLRNRFFGE